MTDPLDLIGRLRGVADCWTMIKVMRDAADLIERQHAELEQVRIILRDEQGDEQSDLEFAHLSSCRLGALTALRAALREKGADCECPERDRTDERPHPPTQNGPHHSKGCAMYAKRFALREKGAEK